MQLSFFKKEPWSVGRLTQRVQENLASDPELQDVWVAGEVSNFIHHGSGHVYFTLKDQSSAVKCVMWRNQVARLSYLPANGDSIEVHGGIGVYEPAGQYQLYVDTIQAIGEGLLYQEYLRLKARLEAEGLFAPERKRPIPHWPGCIGLVTSPSAAALRDVLNTLRRRYTLAQIVFAPTAVQGSDAPDGVVAALAALCQVTPRPDVILVVRGGGSIEDLWCFNDERVARAIAGCPIPVISGVGHETDMTIADFAADLRAATPTAAAEVATPNRADLQAGLAEQVTRLERALQSGFVRRRAALNDVQNRLLLRSPQTRLRTGRQRLDELTHRANVALHHSFSLQQAHLKGLELRLANLNPLAVLNRGYAIVETPAGRVVVSASQVQAGDRLVVRLADGRIPAQVTGGPVERGEAAHG